MAFALNSTSDLSSVFLRSLLWHFLGTCKKPRTLGTGKGEARQGSGTEPRCVASAEIFAVVLSHVGPSRRFELWAHP